MLSAGINICLGLELKWLTDHIFSCRFSLLSRNKNNLDIEQKHVAEGSLSSILSSIPKNYPVALSLGGKGVLNKLLQTEGALTEEQLLQNAYPGVDLKDFYYQVFQTEKSGMVNIVRKSLADPVIDVLSRAGLKIYSLSLGVTVTAQIWSQLNSYDSELRFDGHLFSFSAQKELAGYQQDSGFKSQFPVKIGNEKIPEENIVAYASAFQLILYDRVDLIIANADEVNLAFENFIDRLKLKKQGVIFMFVIFVALLLSFLVFNYYNTENARLSRIVGNQATHADNADLLKQQIGEQEHLLKQLAWNGGYNYGYLLNEIGSSVPKQLTLKNVLMNDFKTETEKQYMQPNIKITGVTSNLAAVNNWIFILKEKSWVKTVKLLQYQQNTDGDDYQFNLLITY